MVCVCDFLEDLVFKQNSLEAVTQKFLFVIHYVVYQY